MKFKVIIDGGFLHGTNKFEKDNTHDSDNFDDMSDDDVHNYHQAGFISLDGLDDVAPAFSKAELSIDNSSQSVSSTVKA